MAELYDLPDLGPITEPQLDPAERMLAASQRLREASQVSGLPIGHRIVLASLAGSLAAAAAGHDVPCGARICPAERLADTLLGREVRRG